MPDRSLSDDLYAKALAAFNESPSLGFRAGFRTAIDAVALAIIEQARQEERERLQSAFASALEAAGWSSGEEFPTDEALSILGRVIEDATLDQQQEGPAVAAPSYELHEEMRRAHEQQEGSGDG